MTEQNADRELLERELLSSPVGSLQYMLRQLAQVYPFLPELVVDGEFGQRTLESVMLFQRELHPPVTGVVDRGTWEAIQEEWMKAEEQNGHPRPTRIFPAEGTEVAEGVCREYMILPQTMLQVLGNRFEGILADVPDGEHGPASAENTRWLQRAAGLPETGVMDRATWDMLSRLYEVFIVEEMEGRPAFTGGWG
ncbi:peptidoglycan-binding domain-containing protein [Oscillospiraceae bacterium 50-16]|nr:peptidoglycan-binding protein [Lawsonibacter sp.]